MKYIVLLLAISSLSFIPPAKTKVVFFGDSITQAAVKPNGFITKIDSLIKKEGKSADYELIGAGISGNRVTDLYLRLEKDVLDQKPDIVVIYIGINDIWHKVTSGTGTDAPKYEVFYRAIIKKLRERSIKVVLCTPTVIGERKGNTNEQDGDLNRYSEIVRNIAKDLSLQVCDLREAFQEYLETNNPGNAEKGILTADRVHLNDAGNMLAATEMWKVIRAMPN